jgi:predicted phosphodiesterase
MNNHYRLAVLADIHGNLPALEAVLADLEPYQPLDGILVAGDIVAGPGQQAVFQRLLDLDAIMIQGNGDLSVAQIEDCSAPEYMRTALQYNLIQWTHAHLTREQLTALCALPEQRVIRLTGADPIRMVHGSPRSIDELVLPNRECNPQIYYTFTPLEEVLPLVDEPVLIFGHTHTPWVARNNGRLAFNPGAVCFPENFYIGAQYALLEWDGAAWQVQHRQVQYDLKEIERLYRESGLYQLNPLARLYLHELFSGVDYLPLFFGHARRIAEQAGMNDSPYFPDEVWLEAERTFDWGSLQPI